MPTGCTNARETLTHAEMLQIAPTHIASNTLLKWSVNVTFPQQLPVHLNIQQVAK